MSNNTYRIEYATTGRSSCKQAKCKKQIEKGNIRIGAIFPSERFETDGVGTDWFHPNCFFDKQKKARKTTKKVDDIDDLIGFDDLSKSDQKSIKNKVEEQHEFFVSKNAKSKPKSKSKKDSPVKPKSSSWVVNSDNEDEEHTSHTPKDKKKSNNNNNNNNNNKNKFNDDDLFSNINDDDNDQDEIMKSIKKPAATTTTTTTTSSTTKTNNSNTNLIKSKSLKSILIPNWLSNLEKIIKEDKQLYDEIIGDKRNSKCLPSESNQIFTSLNSVGSPKNCNVIIVGSSPDTKRITSSGFSYCDNSSERWKLQSIKTYHRNLIRLALLDLGYITKEETIDSIQEVLKEIDLPSDSPKDWFKSTSKQGVLWLNSTSLTSIEGDDDYESDTFKKHEKYWKPIIEEIIRCIFNSKIEDDSPSGVIFVLLGKQSIHFKQTIQLIHSEYMGAIPIEFIEGVSPVLETFIGSNCFKKINNSLGKLSLSPIDWWKPKEEEDDDDEEEEEEVEEEEEEKQQHQQKQQQQHQQNVEIKNTQKYQDGDDNNKDLEKKSKSNNTIKLPPGEQFINNNDNDEDIPPNDKDIQNNIEEDDNNDGNENIPQCNLIQENGTRIQLKLGQAFTLGRTILDIRDKLVSRNQAIVTMLRDISTGSFFVELVPKGQNPVHLVMGDDDFQPLTQDSKYKLFSGETFLLCSQKYPFTVEMLASKKTSSNGTNNTNKTAAISFSPKSKTTSNLSSSQSSSSSSSSSSQSNKRPLNNDYDDFEGDGHSNKNHSSPAKKKIATPGKNSEKPKPKSKPKQKKKEDFIDEDDYQEEEEDSDDDYVPPQNDSDDDDEYGPGFKPFIKSRSQDKPKCKYGSSCYRTNPDHLRDFSHPPK
ncbi:hypothetical protein ACTA71_007861 [Dictyostelium dimigraforme]